MSTIKPKKGKCIDCPTDAPEQFLTAKRCQRHYWLHRQKIAAKKPAKQAKEKKRKDLSVFFASQLLQVPSFCEECGESLLPWKNSKIFQRAIIAHILPKRENGGFPSVATHPQNRMFYCPDCHTDFDNKGAAHAAGMKSLPVMRERYQEFKNSLTEAERMRVPEYLK